MWSVMSLQCFVVCYIDLILLIYLTVEFKIDEFEFLRYWFRYRLRSRSFMLLLVKVCNFWLQAHIFLSRRRHCLCLRLYKVLRYLKVTLNLARLDYALNVFDEMPEREFKFVLSFYSLLVFWFLLVF